MPAAPILFATLTDVLAAAAPAFSIPVAAARVYQMEPDANGEKPYVVVHLPVDAPWWNSKWAGSGQKIDTTFTALATIVCEVPAGVLHLLGDNGAPGALNLNENVINAIEAARATFIAACPTLVDMTVTGGSSWKAETRILTSTITVSFLTRATAGSR